MIDILSLAGTNATVAIVVTYLYAKWKVGKELNGMKKDIKEIKERLYHVEQRLSQFEEIRGELKVIHELVMKLLNGRK